MPTIEEQGGWPGIVVSAIEKHYADKSARKAARSEQEFQEKHDEIQGVIENLAKKLSDIPDDARNTPDYLKLQDKFAQAIQDRDAHWKSQDHPNALMKFGKMLGKDLRFKKQAAPIPVAPPVYGQPTIQTPASQGESVNLSAQPAQPASDRVDMVDGHLKASRDPGSPALPASTVSLGGSEAGPAIPTGPAYKVQGPQTPAKMKAAAEASQLVAAAPLSPEQVSAQQTQAEVARQNALNDSRVKWAKDHGASPEIIEQLVQTISGVPQNKAKALTGSKPYKGADGKYYQAVENADGTISSEPMPADYVPPPSTTKMTGPQLLQDSYLATIGLPFGTAWDTLSNAQRSGFELYKNELARRSSNRQATITDRDGNVHIIDLASSSGPVEVTPSARSAGNPSASGGASKPKPTAAGGANTGETSGKGGKIFDFKKSTPAYNKLSGETQEDQRLADYADSWINIPPGQRSSEDYQFVIKLVHANAGRVNLPEIDAAFGAGGWENWAQRVYSKTISGELPDTTRKQLLALVHRQLDADKKTLQQTDNPSEATPNSSNMTDDEFLMKVK